MRRRQRLEELASGVQALVGHDHVGARQCERSRRRQASRARPYHQHIAGDFLHRLRRVGFQSDRRGRGRPDVQTGLDLGQAGALARPAIYRDQAVKTHAHPAKRPAWRTGTGLAHRRDMPGSKGGGDGLPLQRLDLSSVESETDGCVGPQVGVLQAHGKRSTMP